MAQRRKGATMKTLLAVACGLLPCTLLSAQGIELRGTVRDPDARPVAGVEVRAAETRALTDSLGRFVLRGLSGDSVRLELRRIGYQALTRTISLREPPVELELVLSPDPVVLPEIRTTARADKPARYLGTTKYDGFFQRQKLGLGTFISREQIERMNAFHTLEIFRGIPGMYVSVGNPGDPYSADIRLARCTGADAKVSVWIDGRLQIGGGFDRGNSGWPNPRALSTELAALLEQIAPAGIEMIEIYRGASQIPGVFHWDGCAVIAIWTRYNRGADSAAGRPH
jgi:hypothetical protein